MFDVKTEKIERNSYSNRIAEKFKWIYHELNARNIILKMNRES